MRQLTWVGHATVLIETGSLNILTDPVLGPKIGPIQRRGPLVPIETGAVDVVLISHQHHDHLDLPSLRALPGSTQLIVPAGAGGLLRGNGFRQVTELSAGEAVEVRGVTFEAVPAVHDGRRVPVGTGPPALGYRISGQPSIYFAGDTDLYPEMAALASTIDLALLPVGGWGPNLRGGHMDPDRAAQALTLIRPKTAIAIHWGTLWPVGMRFVRPDRFSEPGRRFQAAAQRLAPEVVIPMLSPGDRFALAD
jgi:L-ascorbate metabolism protein UlaG (beta-lactamase superfamily)